MGKLSRETPPPCEGELMGVNVEEEEGLNQPIKNEVHGFQRGPLLRRSELWSSDVCLSLAFLYVSSCATFLIHVKWGLFVGCLTSQQQASVSLGRICLDKFTCFHTEIEVADQTFYIAQSQYTDTGPTSPSADPTAPGPWQGSHWSANF